MHDNMEDDALNSILGDLDGVEGREVCQSCGKPMDEMPGDEDEKDHPIEDPKLADSVNGGMKITVEPMTAEKAKEALSKVTDDEEDHDDFSPLML
jgi:hypothetical protein